MCQAIGSDPTCAIGSQEGNAVCATHQLCRELCICDVMLALRNDSDCVRTLHEPLVKMRVDLWCKQYPRHAIEQRDCESLLPRKTRFIFEQDMERGIREF